MTSPVTYADVYTDFQGLAKLRTSARENTEESLREVAGQFEAIFIQMMLKSMREASLGEGLMDGDHVKTYQSMFDQQIAIDLSKSNSLGIADLLVQQLRRNGDIPPLETAPNDLAAPAGVQQNLPIERTRRADTVTVVAEKPRADDWKPDSPETFVKALWPYAQRAADTLGTRPEVLISQAALETGWGKKMIRGVDGANSFNLFGIKADASWKGDRAVTETVEFRDGLMRKERATFRAYASVGDSMQDYVQFLKANPRYRTALEQAADVPAFTRALAEAGYATDPDYSDKINRILDSQRLHDAVGSIILQVDNKAGDLSWQ